MDDVLQFLEPGKAQDELVVVLHGYAGGHERMAAVREAIHDKDAKPNADIYTPRLPYGESLRCTAKAEAIVADLVHKIDWLVSRREKAGGGYRSIALIGHSFGAVLTRKIAILAYGEQQDINGDVHAPFEPEFADFRKPRAWAKSIHRIVLLAGMNRGWSVSAAMDWWTTFTWSIGELWGEMLGRPHTLFAVRKGAPFLVQTRLQWLALMDPEYGPKPGLEIVQLLGTNDDFVSPDDNVDYSIDLFGAESHRSYFYIEVGRSSHGDVITMWSGGSKETEPARAERRSKFITALTAKPEKLASESIPREQMADNLPPESDRTVTDVVFVIHGIRDKGFWTQKIARAIKHYSIGKKRPDGKELKFESWTESYGYFAMLPFVLPPVRQRKVEWLMDRYAEARARYPRADFHYVGHSNGTYLAAQALADYPVARFKRIVFAGSVVRCDYPWTQLIPKRVEKVLNYVATRDWVVAMLPKALQPLRGFNLGGAGFDGFDEGRDNGPVHNARYIVGGHSAGHEEPHWNDIACFIVSGDAPKPQYPPFGKVQSPGLQRWSGRAYWLFWAVLGLALAIGAGLLGWTVWTLGIFGLIAALSFLGYYLLVKTIIMRF